MLFRTIATAAVTTVAALLVSGAAMATTQTLAGTDTRVSNCIPFGCPDSYGDHMGFIYKNLSAFTLNAGDTIAFDLGLRNDLELDLVLSLASTTTNGGATVDSAGFTTIGAINSGVYGDTIIGNYDAVFTATSTFTFNGGGLVVNFENTNGPVNDTTYEQNLVWSIDNAFTVGRYYGGATIGDMSRSALTPNSVGNMQITTGGQPPLSTTAPVPLPAALPLLAGGLGLIGLVSARRKRS